MHVLAHRARIQALRHLVALRGPVLLHYVSPARRTSILQIIERHRLLCILLLLLTPRLLRAMGGRVAIRGRGRLLRQVVRRHVLGRLLELPGAHSVVVCVHLVLLAAEVDLILIDNQFREENAVGLHLASLARATSGASSRASASVAWHG